MFSDFPVCDTIQKRHSVRTFDAKPLNGETLEKLTAYAKDLRNPFNIPVTVHVLETGDGSAKKVAGGGSRGKTVLSIQ